MSDKKATPKEKAQEKPYTLRPLKDKDVWPVLDIVGKVFPDELSTTFSKIILDGKTTEEVGAEVVVKIVLAILKNMRTVHDEVYGFLADVSGIPASEIEEMEFGTAPMMIWDIVGDVKNVSFFKVVSKLLL